MSIVVCRARLGHDCDHGKPVRVIYGDLPMSSDGLWNGRSVVCTPCYMRLLPFTPDGMGMKEDVPEAIEQYRESRRPMNERVASVYNQNKGATIHHEEKEDGSVHVFLHFDGDDGGDGHCVLYPGGPIRWM